MPNCVPWGSIGSNVCCEAPFAPIIATTAPVSGTNSSTTSLTEETVVWLTNGTPPANPANKRSFLHSGARQICTEYGSHQRAGVTIYGGWGRDTWAMTDGGQLYDVILRTAPDLKGGTKARVYAFDYPTTTRGYTDDNGWYLGKKYFQYQNNLRLHYGMRPWYNSTNNTWYIVIQGTDCIGATCAPYFGIIDTNVWVARIRPKFTNTRTVSQSGAYSCPNVQISTTAFIPRAHFSTGTPTLPGIHVDLHWRSSPLDGGSDQSYPFGGSITLQTHTMNFDFRNTFLIQVTTDTAEETSAWQSFEVPCCSWPVWPPSYPYQP